MDATVCCLLPASYNRQGSATPQHQLIFGGLYALRADVTPPGRQSRMSQSSHSLWYDTRTFAGCTCRGAKSRLCYSCSAVRASLGICRGSIATSNGNCLEGDSDCDTHGHNQRHNSNHNCQGDKGANQEKSPPPHVFQSSQG